VTTPPGPSVLAAAGVPTTTLLVVGAHLRGQPLHHELEDLGARFLRAARTADAYRLVALPTVPRKPGLVPTAPGVGAPVEGELYELSTGALGAFLARLPAPMTLGSVTLEDGTCVVGFGCSPVAAAGAEDITALGSWRAYLAG